MFIECLEKYRNEYNFFKKEIAHKLDVSESFYGLVENGKRKP